MDFSQSASEITFEAKIIRADGTEVDLGEVAYYHKNPLKRAWRNARRAVRTRRWGTVKVG